MNNDPSVFSLGLLLVAAMVIWEGIRYLINYLLGRITRDDYVTRQHCKQCPAKNTDSARDMNELKREIRENFGIVKGVLLVVASKAGVPMEELKELMRN